jgi:hypothetical protein
VVEPGTTWAFCYHCWLLRQLTLLTFLFQELLGSLVRISLLGLNLARRHQGAMGHGQSDMATRSICLPNSIGFMALHPPCPRDREVDAGEAPNPVRLPRHGDVKTRIAPLILVGNCEFLN